MEFASCSNCPNRVVCRCLNVTEGTIVEAITRLELRTVKEIQRHTGAGSGCTCCHSELREYLADLTPARAACA
jgi:NifU-like protein